MTAPNNATPGHQLQLEGHGVHKRCILPEIPPHPRVLDALEEQGYAVMWPPLVMPAQGGMVAFLYVRQVRQVHLAPGAVLPEASE